MKQKTINKIILVSLMLFASTTPSLADGIFKIVDGISDERLKATMETNVNHLLEAMNTAARQNTKSIKISKEHATPEAIKELDLIWKSSAMNCPTIKIMSKCLKTSQGYQVRGIPVDLVEADKEEQRQEWELKADKRISGLLSYIENVFLENKGNAFGAQVLEDYLQYADLSYEEVLALLDGAAPVVTTYQPVSAKLAALERVSHTAPGKPFKDLNLTDYKTGEPITLGEVIDGKVALIDFWASWCGPCRREIPNIKKIHEQYGGKDFVVVGLNVWDRPDGQARVIKDMEMTWTQLTDVTRNATDTYGVEGIPQILLIGKDGVIIARDLRGEDIEKAVKKALGR